MSKTIFNIICSSTIGGGMEDIYLEYSKIINKKISKNNSKLVCIFPENFCHLGLIKNENISCESLNIKGHFDIFAALKLWKIYKKYSPNLIICHSGRVFATINLCKKFFNIKSKIIAVNHGGNPKRILNFDGIITVAKHIEKRIIDAGFSGKILTIYNGIKIKEDEPKNKNIIFNFGLLSRLSSEKNFPLAIKNFAKFNRQIDNNSRLIIAGEGPEKENLLNLIKQEKIENNVEFIGWINDLEKFFDKVDVFIHPALYEPFGLVILQSMNHFTPVIAANNCGPAEIINHKIDGFLFDINDENSLFENMKFCYHNQDKLPKIAIIAKNTLKKRFSKEIMANNLVKFIENI